MSQLADVNSVAELEVAADKLIVAFASSDGEMVNQHFGSSLGFHVYAIDGATATPLAAKSFAKEQRDGNDDKLKPKLAWLTGCELVYCGSVGGTATNELIKLGAHPVIVKGGPDIEEIVTELQQDINGAMSPLLERIFKQKTGKDNSRFAEMADEEWDE
ncbi:MULTISPECIES: NifB/NifX family molybdenum-iron cluster-binding protein [Methylomonas]|uniref:Dinitrogenase iron-molybdenum cofactor n=2 Tax=Methylomonas TaxID=416 RepID=A0A126T4U8_9GAMM|nr:MULTISPECIES: NifB/NifX family molybdenum-iron cluster-binding protein [Methylomonas]AMK77096.1 dinitrogenase iron-molybdenum cofactor [Methylomonas denitrificans]OAH97159.1 dinitrogenase iron-molybdenum cofactor [Methylomonas methanica]TCV82603.1 nitrogen fixation protein NifX [Methylomonas methanica]